MVNTGKVCPDRRIRNVSKSYREYYLARRHPAQGHAPGAADKRKESVIGKERSSRRTVNTRSPFDYKLSAIEVRKRTMSCDLECDFPV
jgi:hypothetical protein